MIPFKLPDTNPLPDDQGQHKKKDDRFYDTEYPDIDLVIRNAKQMSTFYQYFNAPVKERVDKMVPANGGY